MISDQFMELLERARAIESHCLAINKPEWETHIHAAEGQELRQRMQRAILACEIYLAQQP